MKELKLPKPEQATTDQITNDSFIGVDFGENTGKAIVIKKDRQTYTGLIRTPDITTTWARPTKKEYAENALHIDKEVKVFMFDYLSDLIAWWIR